jgi:2-dehydro-3-deoxyphosphooctonate aldolase (KDO 8-P synthase)
MPWRRPEALKEIAAKAGIGLVYKTSFDKANRTSARSARGLGSSKPAIFAEIRERTGLSVLTDVHEPDQCAPRGQGSRRAADPGLPLPPDRSSRRRSAHRQGGQCEEGPVSRAVGHDSRGDEGGRRRKSQVLVTERGVSFGYNTLVSDMRALPILAETGAPVIFDATHSVQQPGGQGTQSGGERRFVPVLARAAVAVGVAGLFIETHQDPDRAPSDGPNMLPLNDLPALLAELDRDRPVGEEASLDHPRPR